VRPDSKQLIPSTNNIVQEFADMLGVIAVAAADNAVTREEARAIRAKWEDLKSETEGFVRHCEVGDFGALKESVERRAPR
jgi:hypothetical protein